MEMILEILKYTLPSVVVFLTAYFLFDSHLKSEENKRIYEIRLANQRTTLPVRLQAYERMTMFLERISPNNLIPRIKTNAMSARNFQLALLTTIRAEYEHNLSQQIYISSDTWMMITNVKEEIIKVINLCSGSLPAEASAMDLSKKIFEFFISNEQAMPTQKALDMLKVEVRKIY